MTRSQILTLLMDLGPLTFEEIYWSANSASVCQEYRLQWEVQSLIDLGLVRSFRQYASRLGIEPAWQVKFAAITPKITAGCSRPRRRTLARIPASCVELD